MISKFDKKELESLVFFLSEVLKREVCVLEGRPYDYVAPNEALDAEIKYWSPNHATHHDLAWLLEYIYRPDVSLTNQIMNTLLVKFYGPNEAILNCLGETEFALGRYVDFEKLPHDREYLKWIHNNLLEAKANRRPQWGTYELHTSLQTAAKKFAGHGDWSNVVEWIASMKDDLVNYYQRPDVTMEGSYNKLCSYGGIGAYYGYNTSIKLARISGIQMDEDENFVIAGSGATKTLMKLYPDMKKDGYTTSDVVRYLRDNQASIFELDHGRKTLIQELKPHEVNKRWTDKLTIFGCEVTCCQKSVYDRFLEQPELINRRKVPFGKGRPSKLLNF